MAGRVLCVLAVILCIAVSPVNSLSLWYWQYPSPQGNNLNDVDVLASGVAVAVGNLGAVVKTVDGGVTWIVRPVIPGQPNLHGVSFVNASTIVAVSGDGTIRRSTDEGTTWVPQASGTTNALLDVDFADGLHATAVGSNGTILRSNDGGVTWDPQTSGSSATLHGVCLVDAATGTAVGTGGTILRTTDGGATWTPQTSGTSATLQAVDFWDVNTGIAVGGGSTVLGTTDGGANWSLQPVPLPGYTLHSVDMTDASHAVAVGAVELDISILIRTSDGGANWSLVWDQSANLFGGAMFNVSNGVAVGAAGMIRRITGGGTGWPQEGGGLQRYAMKALDFFDPQRGVAVSTDNGQQLARNSRAYATTDGGVTWNVVSSFPMHDLLDVAFADANTVYAVGNGPSMLDESGTVYRSVDGGITWAEFFAPACFPASPTCVWFGGIDFAGPGTGVAVGSDINGGAIVEILGGVATHVTSPTMEALNAVSVPTPLTACAVGYNGVIITGTPGGLWSTQSSGTSVTLNDVCFVDHWTGTAVGAMGTILRTTDGGITWVPQVSGTTANLTSVSFLNATDGIIGAGPILLKTRNGGSTWVPEDMPTNTVDVAYRDAFNVTAVGGDENIIVRPNVPVPVLFQNFAAFASPRSVVLRWTVNTSEIIRGLRVYRSEGQAGEIDIARGLIGPGERSFVDHNVVPGERYSYTLAVVDRHGSLTRSRPTTVEIPRTAIALHQNHPNPFNPSTHIRFSLPARMHVKLTVYDAAGRRIATLVDEIRAAGEHEVIWQAIDVASGVYLYCIDADGVVKTSKMTVLK